MTVLPIETKVKLPDGGYGVISAIMIGQSGCSYRVVWWDAATRKEEWLNAFEVACDEFAGKPLVIGFANSPQAGQGG